MNRRQVLKNLGYGAGALVVTPTVMSLLQSCNNEPEFIPVFLSMGEGHALRRIVDLIIPSDDKVPGAVDVGVHSFIDSYYNEVLESEDQEVVRVGFKLLADKFRSTFTKELEEGKPEEFDQLLATYLKTTKEEQIAYNRKMGEFYQAYENDKTAMPDTDAGMFSLLANLRGMSMWAWKSSEEIGKNVLWYDPIPGQQKGCIPLSEAGNGKAMAL
ncbi:MAG: gluconate 2-dehydrogenase subunit 3 family protein [Bacteroidota bacterium]